MLNHSCHVHVACVTDDPLLASAQDDVAIFFENRALLTKDLLVMRPQSASYSWRCIKACDVVLLIVGTSYGSTNISGVSQLHISYTNAKTKNKPIIVLAHQDILNQPPADRKLIDFMGVIELQSPESVYYFDEQSNISSLLSTALDKLNLDAKICPQGSADLLKISPALKPPAVLGDKKYANQGVFNSVTPSKENESIEKQPSPKTILSLDDEFSISCTAHAFKGGTLIEVSFVASIKWRQVASILADIITPFTEQALSRAFNELVDKKEANMLVANQYPDVHAVSRLQVVKADAIWIQDEIELAGWIEPVGQGALWHTTDRLKQLIQDV